MSTEQSHIDSQNEIILKVLKKSHRTRPEQLVGLGIYIILVLGIEALFSLSSNNFGILYVTTFGLSMWSLWRVYSLRVLKLELSVFLAQFAFQIIWKLAHVQILLSLVMLILLWCNTLMATMLFWKKEKLSGILLLYPILWIFYLVGVNMYTCMSIP